MPAAAEAAAGVRCSSGTFQRGQVGAYCLLAPLHPTNSSSSRAGGTQATTVLSSSLALRSFAVRCGTRPGLVRRAGAAAAVVVAGASSPLLGSEAATTRQAVLLGWGAHSTAAAAGFSRHAQVLHHQLMVSCCPRASTRVRLLSQVLADCTAALLAVPLVSAGSSSSNSHNKACVRKPQRQPWAQPQPVVPVAARTA